MSEEPSITAGTDRERVVLVLAFLASEECQAACHAIASPEKLAYAWCRLWFDEIYVPGTRYLDGIKGDQSEAAVRRFQSCFTADERAALERFHRFLELRVDRLSEADRQRAAFPQNDAWNAILRHASYLLEELAPDPSGLQQRLHGIVQTFHRESPNPLPDVLQKVLQSNASS